MLRQRIVLFDVDNTLTSSDGAGRRSLEGAVAEITGAPAVPRVPFAGRTDPIILADVLGRLGLDDPTLPARILERYLERLAGELARHGGEVLPGVPELLDALAGRPGVHVGLLTGNVERGAALKLRAHGLWERFAFGAYGDDAPTRPELLPVALERWRVACRGGHCALEDVWVIGDTVHDVAVARAYGARAVAVGTGAPHQERAALLGSRPDLFFEDLSVAAPFLRALAD